MEWFSSLVALILLPILWVFLYNRRPRDFPPGPMAIPVVGYYPFLAGKNPFKKLRDLGRKYGGIYSLKMGNRDVVIINSWKYVKEALVNQGDVFAYRPVSYTFNDVRGRTDLSSSDGEEWKEKKNFTLQSLRHFGYGTSTMENLIAEQVEIAVDDLKTKVGQKINFHKFFFTGFLNIIWMSVAGKRIDRQEQKDKEFDDIIATLIAQASSTNPLQYAPMWRHIPRYNRQHLFYLKMHGKLMKFIDNVIDDHIATYKEGHLRDFIDVYLAEIEKRKKSINGDPGVFEREHLKGILYNLNNGGVDTGNSTVEYSLLYMATWPEIQQRVHEELDRVVGRNRRPSYAERKMLPYTEAVLLETQRVSSVLPLLFPHSPRKTTKLHEYTIPKGTFTLINAWAVHNDPATWGDPEVFRPERYLNDQGDAVAPEYLIPFSLGRRLCPGDNMARVEMFVYFTYLMQNFSFSLVPDEPPPSLDPVDGLVVHPEPFSLIITSR